MADRLIEEGGSGVVRCGETLEEVVWPCLAEEN